MSTLSWALQSCSIVHKGRREHAVNIGNMENLGNVRGKFEIKFRRRRQRRPTLFVTAASLSSSAFILVPPSSLLRVWSTLCLSLSLSPLRHWAWRDVILIEADDDGDAVYSGVQRAAGTVSPYRSRIVFLFVPLLPSAPTTRWDNALTPKNFVLGLICSV